VSCIHLSAIDSSSRLGRNKKSTKRCDRQEKETREYYNGTEIMSPPYIQIISATICDTALVSLGCDSSLALAKWSAYLENDGEAAEQETTKALVSFAIDNTNALTLGERASLPDLFGPFPVTMALGEFHATSNIPGTTAIWLFMFKMTLTALATDGSNAQMVALGGRVHEAMLRLEALRGQMKQDTGEMEALARDIIKITEENERKYHAATVSDGGACLVDTAEWTRVVQTAFNLCTGSSRAIAEAHDVSSLVGKIASCLDETGSSEGNEGNHYKTVTAVAVLVRGVALYGSIHADALQNNVYLRGQWENMRGTLMSKFLPMATSFLPGLMAGLPSM
jgi:ribose 5-phosphate isomerase RpiB